MTSVGIRALKNSLGEYIRRVRGGETIVVTDRGTPVARIIPVAMPANISRLLSEGRVSWSGKRFVPPSRPVKPRPGSPLASDIVSEHRD